MILTTIRILLLARIFFVVYQDPSTGMCFFLLNQFYTSLNFLLHMIFTVANADYKTKHQSHFNNHHSIDIASLILQRFLIVYMLRWENLFDELRFYLFIISQNSNYTKKTRTDYRSWCQKRNV